MPRQYFLLVPACVLAAISGCHASPNSTSKPVQDRAALLDEIKTDQAAIASIKDELFDDEKDATDAEELAKNPPADLPQARRTAYIDKRKNEEQYALDAAKDSRERLKEAQKSLDDASARLAALPATAPVK